MEGLANNIESRQGSLKVLIEDRESVVDSTSAGLDILGQVRDPRQIHAIAGGEEDLIDEDRVTPIKARFD